MKGLIVFFSLITGMVFSVTMATSEAATDHVMESHGSLKISVTTPHTAPLVNKDIFSNVAKEGQVLQLDKKAFEKSASTCDDLTKNQHD